MGIKYRSRTKSKTIARTFRLPKELDERITDLAIKNLMTKSAWVIRCLEQKAYKHITHE